MKKPLLFALSTAMMLLLNLGLNNLHAANRPVESPKFIIIDIVIGGYIDATADDYPSATTVTIDLLDGNGNVLTSATTRPNSTYRFTQFITQARRARATYGFHDGSTAVVYGEVIPQ
jgi:hypothetical protein